MTKDELQGYLKQSGPVRHENQDTNNQNNQLLQSLPSNFLLQSSSTNPAGFASQMLTQTNPSQQHVKPSSAYFGSSKRESNYGRNETNPNGGAMTGSRYGSNTYGAMSELSYSISENGT